MRHGNEGLRAHLARAPHGGDHAGAVVGGILFGNVDPVPAGVFGAVESSVRACDQAIDCRDRTKLATENCGVIAIKRRKTNLALPSLLKELHSRFIKQDCGEIQLSYEVTRSVPKESAP